MQDTWFVKLHRKLLDNPIASNPLLIWLFCYLLLKVSYKDHIFFLWKIKIEQKKGQAIISKKDIAKSFWISRWTLDSYLGILESEHIISIKTNNKYTVLTINNREKYQSLDIKIASDWTTTWTSTWHQLEHQPDTINKDNNLQEWKEIIIDTTIVVEPPAVVHHWNKDINEILEKIKMYNNGIVDWTKEEQRNYWKHLLTKLKQIDSVKNNNYSAAWLLEIILQIISKNEYHSHKIVWPKKIYYELAGLMQICKQEMQKEKKSTVKEF